MNIKKNKKSYHKDVSTGAVSDHVRYTKPWFYSSKMEEVDSSYQIIYYKKKKLLYIYI